MSPQDIDMDTNYVKHCVRFYGWLTACKEYRKQIKKSPKYFTLCGTRAIDVFMLEYEGVLERDKNKKLPNVIICEENEETYIEIINIVRPPVKEAVILGKLQEILTFEDDDNTKGRSIDEFEENFKIRKKLIIKKNYELLKEKFPFDIINFDPFDSLLDPSQEYNKLYQAFTRIFELQKGIDSFLLLLTTPIFRIHPGSEERIRINFNSNITRYHKIRRTLHSELGTSVYNKIERKKRLAIGFTKSIVHSASHGWNHKHLGIYIYENPRRNKMLSSVIQFTKIINASNESFYEDDIIRIIKHMPEYYPLDSANQNQQVIDHLEKVKKFRDKSRAEFELL
jgi:hypothetical protein